MSQEDETLLRQAMDRAIDYRLHADSGRVYPDGPALDALQALATPLSESGECAESTLALLAGIGGDATVRTTGGRYFGFVNGGAHSAALAARWLADAWDQNAALNVMSPVSARLEQICEDWLVGLLGLPGDSAVGFVSGSSVSLLCGLAAGRNALLQRQGWDVDAKGLFGAPDVRVVVGEQAHSAVFKALSFIGLGRERVSYVACDDQGRMIPASMPQLDDRTLLVLAAGNVNTGSFDPFNPICEGARKAGAWIHVDGAFGLWAAASPRFAHLTDHMSLADSWSADCHKTLNAPYDSGLILCRDRAMLAGAFNAAGDYLQWSDERDGMRYTPEMSRRARAVELWMLLKVLGRRGVAELVDTLCDRAKLFAEELSKCGFRIINDVVFNQVLIAADSDAETDAVLARIQQGGICWCGGSKWAGSNVIRVSVCSHATTEADIHASVAAFRDALGEARGA